MSTDAARMRHRLAIVVSLVGIIWAVQIVNWALGQNLNHLGLVPRTLSGLIGVVSSPFLHVDFTHTLSNTLPLLVLGWLISVRGAARFVGVCISVVLLGGLAVWVLARPAIHVGASGLVFGLFGYIVARAWYERSFPAFAAAAVAVFLYGGLVFGLVPKAMVSFESHLFGMLAGIGVAASEGRPRRRA